MDIGSEAVGAGLTECMTMPIRNIARFVGFICILVGSSVVTHAQAKPVTTQRATTDDGRAVILMSDGTWAYEESGPFTSIVTLTGKCRLQLVKGFFPCNPKALFMSMPGKGGHVTFVKNQGGKQTIFDLAGHSDRQPNLENYYLSIDTFGILVHGQDLLTDDGMEGECHFRMNKTAKVFYFVKCDIYNRAKGTMYNFYLENITRTQRDVVKGQ